MLDVINNLPGAYTFLKINACKKLRYKILFLKYLKGCQALSTHMFFLSDIRATYIIANLRPAVPILCS